ncbi:MAG: FecR domain-containing protein [Chitinophaga sp.]|uniref:FecR family protein n=1 Tax=Chitinophaga sp. TaxID=1869181 RepID=UPI001B0B96F1|nr:FecR domain-containing protein [Chitinophaga sp.]MBO9732858.1 FecR domain-containing protein [Chitinophaga sp.]
MSDQQLIGLLEKYLQGQCTADEQAALESWYENYRTAQMPDREDAQPDLLRMYTDMTDRLKQEGEWQEVPVAVVRSVSFKWRKMAAAAAVLLLVAGAAVWIWSPRANRQLALDTAEGVRKKVSLEDGTQVWLNVGSHLTYPANISSSNREVYLRGEAFFEVAQQAAHPFIIHTANLNVQVLGTRFNVKAYDGEGSIETTLVEGRVAVSRNGNSLVLEPGEKAILKKKTPGNNEKGANSRIVDWGDVLLIVEKVTPEANNQQVSELVWMDNRLEFKDKTFPELARLMSRWYNRKIILTDTFPADYKFKGTFKQETVTDVLKALQITADFNYTIKGDTIYIHH